MEVTTILRATIGLCLKLLNIFLHGVGLYLLHCVQKRTKTNIQLVYISNLSVVELAINLLSFTRNLLKITGFEAFKSREFKVFLTYSYIIDYTILKFCLYMTMIILTLDRLFLITVNNIYRKYSSAKKAKSVVRTAWFLGFLLFVAVAGFYTHSVNDIDQDKGDSSKSTQTHFNRAKEHNTSTASNKTVLPERSLQLNTDGKMFFIFNFVVLVFDFLFLPIAIISYMLIFCVYTRRQKVMQSQRSHVVDTRANRSRWRSFQKSRFYVSMLLIVTFVLFIIPADIIWTVYSLRSENKIVETVTTISYALSYLSDGLIYIAMNRKVKQQLIRRINCIFSQSGEATTTSFYDSERSDIHCASSPENMKKFLDASQGGRQTIL